MSLPAGGTGCRAAMSRPSGVHGGGAPLCEDLITAPPTGSSGTISSATMLMILISGFTAGPAVSL